MSEIHIVLVTVEPSFQSKVSRAWVERTSEAVLRAEVVVAAELNVLITDDAVVRELNRRYTGDDYATDVLSFSLREGEEFIAPDDVLRLGEVVVSYPTAVRQAKEAGHSTDYEIAHLLTHGILHLLDYDHAEPQEERRMRKREAELLGADVHGAK